MVRAWDFASSVQLTNDPDWTVGLLMGRHDATRPIYIIDVIRARLSPGQREQRVKSTAILDGEDVRIAFRRIRAAPESSRRITLPVCCKATRSRSSQNKEAKSGVPIRCLTMRAGHGQAVEASWNRRLH